MPKARKVTRRRKRRTTDTTKIRRRRHTSSPPREDSSELLQATSEPGLDQGRLWVLLDALVDLFKQVVAGIQDPRRATAAATVARAAAVLLNALEPRRRVELVFRTPEWQQLERALVETLAPYPRARDAVVATLQRMTGERGV